MLLAGDDPASKIYVRNKKRACEEIGIESRELLFPESVTEEELIAQIRALNADPAVDAMLVQLPLPKHINEARVLAEIAPEKDADGFHVVNAGRLFTGQTSVLPCTPAGCMELLRRANVEFSGKHAVVVGRSNIVGKPMAMLLLNEHCTVTVCHSRTKDLARFTPRRGHTRAAVGRPGMITGEMIKPGAAVIDVGINRLDNGKLMGDVDFASAEPVAGAITPVPDTRSRVDHRHADAKRHPRGGKAAWMISGPSRSRN